VRNIGKHLGLVGILFVFVMRREFNVALLGKWCWMMLVDRDGL